jgi:hypothetical protein
MTSFDDPDKRLMRRVGDPAYSGKSADEQRAKQTAFGVRRLDAAFSAARLDAPYQAGRVAVLRQIDSPTPAGQARPAQSGIEMPHSKNRPRRM